MKAKLFLCIWVFLCVCACNSRHRNIIPLEDFFENPTLDAYRISPDGAYVSYLAPYKNRMNVYVRLVQDTNVMRVTSVLDRDISFYTWKSNSRIVYLKDKQGDENFHVYSAAFNGTEEKDLTPFDSTRVKILDELRANDSELLIEMNRRRKDIYDVFLLNVDTGELTLLAENPGSVTSWFIDHCKCIRLAVSTDGVNQTLLYRKKPKHTWDTVFKTTHNDIFTPLLFTFDNKRIYALSNLERDKAAVVEFCPVEKREVAVLYENQTVDVGRLEYTLRGKRATAVVFSTDRVHRYYLDTLTRNLYDTLHAKMPGFQVTIISNNKAENLYVLRYENDRNAGVFYLYFREKDSLVFLGNSMPQLDADKLCFMEPFSILSRDSLRLNGYLTFPKGKGRTRLPMIVLPHGGPWWRDFWEFNSRVQFLANRGYAVLQVNYRGSISYGRSFMQASYKQWGLNMQNDITDAVLYAVNEGIADKDRIAIMGGSYGGYATLVGLASTPELYSCGVDIVGVSNLFTLLESIPPYWKPYQEMLYEKIGHPQKDSALLYASSPVFHADHIDDPLLVFQGAKDPRVKKIESDQMVEALRKRGIKVPYIVKDDEGHGFKNQENRLEMYRIIEGFLEENL